MRTLKVPILSITAAEAEMRNGLDELRLIETKECWTLLQVILYVDQLTGVELNDGLSCVRVRVGDVGQLRVFINRIVNLNQENNVRSLV